MFIDEINKISRRSDSLSTSRDVSGEGVQQVSLIIYVIMCIVLMVDSIVTATHA